MKTFYTSDLHFGHGNIIKYCKRPYKTVEEMDRKLIKRMNSRIKKDDVVIHAGDFCFRNSSGGKAGEGLQHKPSYYINQLNGHWVFLNGNHDGNNSLKTPINSLVLKLEGRLINVIHNPKHFNFNYNINFVGHIHKDWKFKKIYHNKYAINLGVDVWNYYPKTYDEIMREFNKWLKIENA